MNAAWNALHMAASTVIACCFMASPMVVRTTEYLDIINSSIVVLNLTNPVLYFMSGTGLSYVRIPISNDCSLLVGNRQLLDALRLKAQAFEKLTFSGFAMPMLYPTISTSVN